MEPNEKKSGFFRQFGDKIAIASQSDFIDILDSLDITFEQRTHDSSSEELWVLMKFMETYLRDSPEHFPFSLIKSEQPDILVEQSEKIKYGIEITESTQKFFIAALRLAEKRGKGEWPVASCFKYGMKPNNLEHTLQHPDKDLWGNPWLGEEGIRNSILFLKDTINKKLTHLNCKEYKGLADVRLLVYFNGPSGMFTSNSQIQKAFPLMISDILSEVHYSRIFTRFHLLWPKNMSPVDHGHSYLVLTADSK